MATGYMQRTVRAYYRAQVATSDAASLVISKLWRTMDRNDIDGSWRAMSGPVARAVAAGQARAASAAPLLTDRVLADAGLTPDPLDTVSPLAFVGYSADGVDLQAVLDSTPTWAKLAIARGASVQDALVSAQERLDRISVTEIHDAGRGALDAAMRLEPQIVGWERYVNTPCCSRCAVLAGRIYSKSEGFLRHPGCKCCHRPVTSKDHKSDQDPMSLFHSMSDAEQDAAFTRDGARAIRDGADINQIVNSRWSGGARGRSAGMSRPGDPYTTYGTTKRSLYYKQQKSAGNVKRGKLTVQRLSPQGVALKAGTDTKLYRQLLRDNGYLFT